MNIFKRFFNKKRQERVRGEQGKFARKIKIGGMYEGYFYMEPKAGFQPAGGRR